MIIIMVVGGGGVSIEREWKPNFIEYWILNMRNEKLKRE